MRIRRRANDTLTPIELFHNDVFEFHLGDASVFTLELLHTGAEVMHTTMRTPGVEVHEIACDGTECLKERRCM